MNLTPKQIRDIIEPYLRILYPQIKNVQITFLVLDKGKGIWKVNVRFDTGDWGATTGGLLAIDLNGEILQFKEGYGWRS